MAAPLQLLELSRATNSLDPGSGPGARAGETWAMESGDVGHGPGQA